MAPRKKISAQARAAYQVTACTCESTKFCDWLTLVRANGWTLKQARDATKCGQTCGLCRPYLRVVKATGRTELPIMLESEIDILYPLTEDE